MDNELDVNSIILYMFGVGFNAGLVTAFLINLLKNISRTIKRHVLKKRVDKSAKDLTDYVDSIINRDDG